MTDPMANPVETPMTPVDQTPDTPQRSTIPRPDAAATRVGPPAARASGIASTRSSAAPLEPPRVFPKLDPQTVQEKISAFCTESAKDERKDEDVETLSPAERLAIDEAQDVIDDFCGQTPSYPHMRVTIRVEGEDRSFFVERRENRLRITGPNATDQGTVQKVLKKVQEENSGSNAQFDSEELTGFIKLAETKGNIRKILPEEQQEATALAKEVLTECFSGQGWEDIPQRMTRFFQDTRIDRVAHMALSQSPRGASASS